MADLKYATELEGKNDCVVTSIHEPTLAKNLFVKCKEGGYIGYSFIEKIAAVYVKLKDKKIVIRPAAPCQSAGGVNCAK